MDRARAEGAHVGQPRRTADVTAHPSWPKVLAMVQTGHLTRAEAAKKLRVRRVTLGAALAAVPKGVRQRRRRTGLRRAGREAVRKEVLWDTAGVALQLTTSCWRWNPASDTLAPILAQIFLNPRLGGSASGYLVSAPSGSTSSL